jgi:hypothetical protein
MLLKRLRVALDLSLRFILSFKTLPVAAIPLVLLPLKRLYFHRTSLTQDLTALVVFYALLCVAVFAWKLVASAEVLAREPALYAQISRLDIQEQHELKRLVTSGKIAVGPPLLDRIAAKTDFIYRDVSGEWRVEREYRRFLKTWAEDPGRT